MECSNSEEAVPTTILALPNLFKDDFISWHDFTEELADDLVSFFFLYILKYLVFSELFAPTFSHPHAQLLCKLTVTSTLITSRMW